MKIGDLVRFTPEDWGTPLEDRALGIVVEIETFPRGAFTMVDVLFPGDSDIYSTGRNTLELVSEVKTFI